MYSSPRKFWIWFFSNIAGMAIYLWLASSLWVKPGTEGEPGGPGDAFYWFFTLVPIILIFFLLNFGVILFSLFRSHGWKRKAMLIVVGLLIIALWLVVLVFDQRKSYRVIDPKYSLLRGCRTEQFPKA